MAARARTLPRPMREGWTDPAFSRIADAVYLVAGLVFPPNRQPSAESGMRRAMASLRISDPDLLARAVSQPGDARDAVLAELTVGETYFFRDGGQLDVLRTEILPALMANRSPGRPVRIWSAGCASGEEPHTLAIIMREQGWADSARILGTDVSRPRLDAARRGKYTRWSLRGMSDARIERWFDKHAGHFELHPAIRDVVSFASLNLVADDYPADGSHTREQDIVLCRNVLIYFDMKSVVHIATRLLASLAPDGWLILGASDPPLFGLVPCEAVMTAGGVLYRRADRATGTDRLTRSPVDQSEDDTAVTSWSRREPADMFLVPVQCEADDERLPPAPSNSVLPPQSPSLNDTAVTAERSADDLGSTSDEPAAAIAYASADYPRAEALARSALDLDASVTAHWVVLVRAIANQGRLRDADDQCTRALDHHRMSPELHYLHAMLLGAANEYREAAKAARRALYLDRHFIMAHLQLGDALSRLGESDEAARAFAYVVRALVTVGDEVSVPASDGVRTSRLRQLAEARFRGLRPALLP